jgi:hypothetical protein
MPANMAVFARVEQPQGMVVCLRRQPQMLRADQQGGNRTIQFRLLRPASL